MIKIIEIGYENRRMTVQRAVLDFSILVCLQGRQTAGMIFQTGSRVHIRERWRREMELVKGIKREDSTRKKFNDKAVSGRVHPRDRCHSGICTSWKNNTDIPVTLQ